MWDVTCNCRVYETTRGISTHTSRVGCDAYSELTDKTLNISTHTSRVGCDYTLLKFPQQNIEFLLTHPVWDVTLVRLSP